MLWCLPGSVTLLILSKIPFWWQEFQLLLSHYFVSRWQRQTYLDQSCKHSLMCPLQVGMMDWTFWIQWSATTHTQATGPVLHPWPPRGQVGETRRRKGEEEPHVFDSELRGICFLLSVSRGRCCSAEWPHIRSGRFWWGFTPGLCGGLQHQNRLLDHCGQYDHPSVLRRSDRPPRTTLRHRWVRPNFEVYSFVLISLSFHSKSNRTVSCILRFFFRIGLFISQWHAV